MVLGGFRCDSDAREEVLTQAATWLTILKTRKFFGRKVNMMAGLRSEWTQDDVRESLGVANESLPEARPTNRDPSVGTVSGMDFLAGEDAYEEPAAERGSAAIPGLPADPPRNPGRSAEQTRGGE